MAVRKEANALSRVAKDPVSRRKFIALGGGSAAAAFLVACGSDSSSTTTTAASSAAGGDAVIAEKFGKGDVGILNYALTLEYLETAFYADVASRAPIWPRSASSAARRPNTSPPSPASSKSSVASRRRSRRPNFP